MPDMQTFFSSVYADSYLAHHGIKGMRWGVRRTPEQLGHKTSSSKVKRKSKEQKNKEKEELAKEKAKKEREAILRDPSKLYKNRDKFTKEEIDQAMKRFAWEKQLRDYSRSQKNTNKETVDRMVSWLETSTKAYNHIAMIYNAFAPEGNKKLPRIKRATK